jgi:hypothetical protein
MTEPIGPFQLDLDLEGTTVEVHAEQRRKTMFLSYDATGLDPDIENMIVGVLSDEMTWESYDVDSIHLSSTWRANSVLGTRDHGNVAVGTQRVEQKVKAAGRLLPVAVRDRQIREWLDHLASEREAGRDPRRALRSIMLRSVIPIAVGARARRIHGMFARPR